jgi:hypothetical protein
MRIRRLFPSIAVLVAIHYLALVSAVPFLHRHAEPDYASGSVAIRSGVVTHTPAPNNSADTCPACQWDQLSKAPPSATFAAALVERVTARVAQPPSQTLPYSPLGLPSSRAPPVFPS